MAMTPQSPPSSPTPQSGSRAQFSIYFILLLLYLGVGLYALVDLPSSIMDPTLGWFPCFLLIASAGLGVLVFILVFSLIWGGLHGSTPRASSVPHQVREFLAWTGDVSGGTRHTVLFVGSSLGILWILSLKLRWTFLAAASNVREFLMPWVGLLIVWTLITLFILSGLDALLTILLKSRRMWRNSPTPESSSSIIAPPTKVVYSFPDSIAPASVALGVGDRGNLEDGVFRALPVSFQKYSIAESVSPPVTPAWYQSFMQKPAAVPPAKPAVKPPVTPVGFPFFVQKPAAVPPAKPAVKPPVTPAGFPFFVQKPAAVPPAKPAIKPPVTPAWYQSFMQKPAAVPPAKPAVKPPVTPWGFPFLPIKPNQEKSKTPVKPGTFPFFPLKPAAPAPPVPPQSTVNTMPPWYKQFTQPTAKKLIAAPLRAFPTTAPETPDTVEQGNGVPTPDTSSPSPETAPSPPPSEPSAIPAPDIETSPSSPSPILAPETTSSPLPSELPSSAPPPAPPSPTIPPSPTPSPPEGLVVYPEVLVTGGKVRLSFVLKNRTGGSLFQIRIFPRIPEALHIFVNVPPVPQVQAGDRLDVSYEIEPSACGEFTLGGDLLYEDAEHHSQWMVIPPVSFAVKCPLLAPTGVNMTQIQLELPRKAQAHREFLVSDLPREVLGQVARRAMTSFNLAAVESIQGTSPSSPVEIWFAGQVTKEERPLYVQVQVLPTPARILVTAWGPDNDAVTGFLARFAEVLTTELSVVRHLQDQARDKIVHAARIGELLVTLQDFCMIEWHRADTRVKLQELINLLEIFDATAPILDEVREWVQKLSTGAEAASQNLSPGEREQLEAALVKWKDAVDQILAKFSLQVKEVTPSAVPA